MKEFIIFTLILFICGLTYCIKDNSIDIRLVIVNLIIAIIFGTFGAIILIKQRSTDNLKWNGGKCSICETNFHLIDINRGYKRMTIYYYECANGHVIKTISKMK